MTTTKNAKVYLNLDHQYLITVDGQPAGEVWWLGDAEDILKDVHGVTEYTFSFCGGKPEIYTIPSEQASREVTT